MQPIVQSFKLN